MIKAPRLGDGVAVTTFSEPVLVMAVEEVLGYDVDHKAWYVGVYLHLGPYEKDHYNIMPRGDRSSHTLYVRGQVAGEDSHWQIYDITTPLSSG